MSTKRPSDYTEVVRDGEGWVGRKGAYGTVVSPFSVCTWRKGKADTLFPQDTEQLQKQTIGFSRLFHFGVAARPLLSTFFVRKLELK